VGKTLLPTLLLFNCVPMVAQLNTLEIHWTLPHSHRAGVHYCLTWGSNIAFSQMVFLAPPQEGSSEGLEQEKVWEFARGKSSSYGPVSVVSPGLVCMQNSEYF
jgi:hypothetical protein